ncbi:MAG: peptidoglycan DD-metalloendopeptidase family protein [Neisseria sp.]|uniref:murein hydrolase activator EnvC family protein n=1 Tax=Neisseria sp. TaxID=192066 RepID=UPI0026DD5416|nr:peptidoglycan DD-metalloendopeptidase family protein [Neisseria sp.]MDO4248947.1 peptidoglycan DD-metalloendopeptidase family protein [Neisseria sp.]
MNPVKPLLLAALIAFSIHSNAAPNSSALQNIRQAISEAQTDLKQKQAAQARAKQTLANSQSALTKAQRELESLNRQQSAAWNNLQKLQAELEKTRTDISSTKAQVARLLESHYKNRQQNAVVLFLKNAEPGQKARYLEYARYINQANEKAIKDLIVQQQQLAEREKAVDAELARLKRLRTQKQAAINRLNKTHNSALQQSQALNSQIDQQNRRIAALRSDEARLNAVLANIARRNAAAKKAQAPAKRQQAEARLAQQRNNTKKNPNGGGVRSTLTAEDRSLQGSDQSNNSGLGKLQGSLRRPVGGSISGRFGQARPGGGTWRGVFFATPPAGVHSIAAGTVAYAGALSGYGNTVVVDHGGGYVSVYTGLGSISAGGGSTVGSGSVLGTSGSLPGGEQGLYFEIRYRNQPMNPLSWVR